MTLGRTNNFTQQELRQMLAYSSDTSSAKPIAIGGDGFDADNVWSICLRTCTGLPRPVSGRRYTCVHPQSPISAPRCQETIKRCGQLLHRWTGWSRDTTWVAPGSLIRAVEIEHDVIVTLSQNVTYHVLSRNSSSDSDRRRVTSTLRLLLQYLNIHHLTDIQKNPG